MNLKKIMDKGAVAKPVIKAVLKKIGKNVGKKAAQATAKGTAKAAGKAAGKKAAQASAKEAGSNVLGKYIEKLNALLDNVDPEDFVKAQKIATNMKKIFKVLTSENPEDADVDAVADMILESESLSEEAMDKEDSNMFKKIIEKLFS